jgi:hypothetical protein
MGRAVSWRYPCLQARRFRGSQPQFVTLLFPRDEALSTTWICFMIIMDCACHVITVGGISPKLSIDFTRTVTTSCGPYKVCFRLSRLK